MNREYLNFAQNQPNVMSDEKTLTVDLEKVIRDKNPALARLLPRFVVAYLKRTIHQDEINRILQAYSHLEPIPFIRAALADMGIRYRAVGLEKLPREGRYLFASNHPFGGMDGMMLCDELERHFGSVKIIVNDLLMHLTPLNPLFIPVNKHGRQKAQYAELFRQNLQSGVQVATFPAGLCSRRHRGVVRDCPWRPSFVKNAIESRRDVVPVYFEGELSSFFLQPVQLPHRRGHPGQSRNALPARRDVPPARKRFPHPLRKTGAVAAARRREARESMGGTAPGIRI